VGLVKSQLRDLHSSDESNQAKLLDHTRRQGMTYSAFLSFKPHFLTFV
jgi:hypothetical protein